MRLMKKLLTILFAFMMVLATTSMVFADEGVSTIENGKITIDNAIDGKTYTIYRIFELESFSDDGTNGRYAYKADSQWNTFLNQPGIKDVYITFDGKYIKWKSGANVDEFAAKALAYARENTTTLTEKKTTAASSTTVTFDNLKLGYYLVDSGVGALCSLDTTNLTANIKEKNDILEVVKQVSKTETGTFSDHSTASIGDTVYFKTTVTAKAGAQNYVLYDTMSEGLTLVENDIAGKYVSVQKPDGSFLNDADFTFSKDPGTGDTWTFKITFNESYLKTLRNELGKNGGTPAAKTQELIITYRAVLNEKAVINADTNTNKTKLAYGDNQETNESSTYVKTYKLPVYKYYKDPTDGTSEKALAGAKFTLSTNAEGTNPIKFVKTTATTPIYRVALTGESATAITEIETDATGKFEIQGLAGGEYYLKETVTPKGYNKPNASTKVKIDAENGNITIGDDTTVQTEVKIENKTGTLLPSTGGVGTTMIYILGAALLIGSGVMLITKKNMK